MPQYFFSVDGPLGHIEAESSEELADDLAAHRHAQQTAGELAGGWLDGRAVVVTRGNGEIVTEALIAGPPAS